MKKTIPKIFFLVILALASPALAQFQNAACRAFALRGAVVPPEGAPLPEGLELTVTYQLNFQKAPALLLVNEPLTNAAFEISFTGLRDLTPRETKMEKKSREAKAMLAPPPESRPAETQATETESQPEPVTRFFFYAPAMFLYPREIQFRYYVRIRSTPWVSELKALDFFHEKKDIEGVSTCETYLNLPAIDLPRAEKN